MAEHADDPKHLDLGRLLDPKKVSFELKSPETPDEIRSRLKLSRLRPSTSSEPRRPRTLTRDGST